MSLQNKHRPRSREGTAKLFLQLQKVLTPPRGHLLCPSSPEPRSRCWADAPLGKASADLPLTLYFVALFLYQA